MLQSCYPDGIDTDVENSLGFPYKLRFEGHLAEAVYAAVDVVVACGEADALDLSTSLD